MTLETAFYIIGIIFMTLMLLILLSIVIGVFLIKKKIDHIHSAVNDKIFDVSHTFEAGKQTVRSVKDIFDKVKKRA